MEKTGLFSSIIASTMLIDAGRRNLMIDGSEREGRIYFEEGIFTTTKIFNDVRASKKPCEMVVMAEQFFLRQEHQFCDKLNRLAISSLTIAIQSFDDAMRTLKVVHSANEYLAAEATYPTSSAYRVKGLPKDAFHIACNAHRTRIYNSLRTPGMNPHEKALYELRAKNMLIAKGLYMEKQRLALGIAVK